MTAKPTVPMTAEQKFFFDLHGWILVPSILDTAKIEAMKAECYAGAKQGYEGALSELLDHPAVAGILNEILGEDFVEGGSHPEDDYYRFRCENSFVTVRPAGWERPAGTSMPHVVRPPQQANAMRYQVAGDKIYAGLTRVVWELEEVVAGQGGTTFLTGSHKVHFGYGGPDPGRPNVSESPWEDSIRSAMEEYSCPPGSAVIFTESLAHSANDWTNPNNARCTVFNCYNSVWAQWHKLSLEHEIIAAMPAKRRTLFRGVWELGGNRAYSEDNRAL